MPIISPTKKLGRSVDSGDLLAQRKRNILNLEIASKKSLGIYKLGNSNNGLINNLLQSQNGLDEYLTEGRVTPLVGGATNPSSFITPGTGTPIVGTGTPVPGPFAPAGTGIVFTNPLNTPTSSHVFERDLGGNGAAYSVTYANNTWVVYGVGNASNRSNVYYGSSLTSLLPLTLFANGGFKGFSAYGNGTWVICGQDQSGSGYNVYYGSDLANLRALPIFGNLGRAKYATYANNTWVICGEDRSGLGYNVYFGPSLTSLTPLAIFGSAIINGSYPSAEYALYANGEWGICGYDHSGSNNNLYFGPTLTSLLPLSASFFGVEKLVYANNTWVVCGGGQPNASSDPIRRTCFCYGPNLSSLTRVFLTSSGPNNVICKDAAYGNGVWAIGLNTNSVNNLYYGSDLSNLTPAAIMGFGGNVQSVVYANGIWGIGGLPGGSVTTAIYYGTNPGSLTAKSAGGILYFLTYQNGIWVAGGQAFTTTGNNLLFGPDLATL
jgi:hypothetical protein